MEFSLCLGSTRKLGVGLRVVRGVAAAGLALLVGLLVVLAAQPAFAVVPIVTNPGFESGHANIDGSYAFDSWSFPLGGNVSACLTPHGGAKALALSDANADPAKAITAWPDVNTSRPVEVGQIYRFAAWAQSDRGASAPALMFWFTDDNGDTVGNVSVVHGLEFGINSSQWKQMQIVRTAPAGATRMKAVLAMYGGAGGGVRFDDVQLDEINSNAGTTNSMGGWTFVNSADMGSGFFAGVGGGSTNIVFMTLSSPREINGAAQVYRVFEPPVDTLSFHVTTNVPWSSSWLLPQVVKYADDNAQPTIPLIAGVYSIDGTASQDTTLTNLSTRRVDFWCAAQQRGAATGDAMYGTISNLKAFAAVHRFRNLVNGFYLYTAQPSERDSLIANGAKTWASEGVSYLININNTNKDQLYRFRNRAAGFYLYSAVPSELSTLRSVAGQKVWAEEGKAYTVWASARSGQAPNGSTDVWRFRNIKVGSSAYGTYLLTGVPGEQQDILKNGKALWKYEGVAFNLAP